MQEPILFKKFEQECYPEAKKIIFEKVLNLISNDMKSTYDKFIDNMDEFLNKLCLLQENKELDEIMSIAISVPYMYMCTNAPCYLFEVYCTKPFLSQSVASMYFPIPWDYLDWSEQIDMLTEYSCNHGLQLFLKRPKIEAYHRKSIKTTLIIIHSILKVFIKDVTILTSYQKLLQSEGFTISFGEFYDWQKPLFSQPVTLDIFENYKETQFVFMRFSEQVYEHKVFDKLNFDQSIFYKCQFINCRFNIINLCDTKFQSCYFKACVFDDIQMYATAFESCVLNDMTMKNVKTDFFKQKNNYFAIYGAMIFDDCNIGSLELIDSDFSLSNVENCMVKSLSAQNCDLSNDFSELISESEILK